MSLNLAELVESVLMKSVPKSFIPIFLFPSNLSLFKCKDFMELKTKELENFTKFLIIIVFH